MADEFCDCSCGAAAALVAAPAVVPSPTVSPAPVVASAPSESASAVEPDAGDFNDGSTTDSKLMTPVSCPPYDAHPRKLLSPLVD